MRAIMIPNIVVLALSHQAFPHHDPPKVGQHAPVCCNIKSLYHYVHDILCIMMTIGTIVIHGFMDLKSSQNGHQVEKQEQR